VYPVTASVAAVRVRRGVPGPRRLGEASLRLPRPGACAGPEAAAPPVPRERAGETARAGNAASGRSA
ncbi:MAG: hypothetical protein AAF845_19380, partial [Bacteroidota bacterium]